MEKNVKPVDGMTVEFRAIKKIHSALGGLTPDQRRRVWAYIADSDVKLPTVSTGYGSISQYQLQSE